MDNAKKKRQRKKHSTEQKAAVLRRHFTDKVAVSDLCHEYKLSPSVFYGWQQQQLIENIGVALEAGGKKSDSQTATLAREVEALKVQLAKMDGVIAKKDGVIAEISAEYVAIKKELGDL